MGYGVYFRDGRWGGYDVPAICDQPGCGASIDRGMAYLCGEEPGSGKGCGLSFCSSHLWIGQGDDDPQMCERCSDDEPPFDPTPDVLEWVEHMLTDDSWEQWRTENPERVGDLLRRRLVEMTAERDHAQTLAVTLGQEGAALRKRIEALAERSACDPVSRVDQHHVRFCPGCARASTLSALLDDGEAES